MKPIYLRIFAFCVIVFGLFGSGIVLEQHLAQKIQIATIFGIVALIWGGFFQFSKIFKSRDQEEEEAHSKDEFDAFKTREAIVFAFFILVSMFMLFNLFPNHTANVIRHLNIDNQTSSDVELILGNTLLFAIASYLMGRVIVWLKYR